MGTSSLPSAHDPPSPDQIIRIPRKQSLPISAPRQTDTFRIPRLLPHIIIRLQLINLALLLQIKDDDTRARGRTQPVPIWGEDQSVDLVASGQGVEVLGFVEVPEHCCAVFAA